MLGPPTSASLAMVKGACGQTTRATVRKCSGFVLLLGIAHG